MSKKIKIIGLVLIILALVETGVILVIKNIKPKTGISLSNDYTKYTVVLNKLKSVENYTVTVTKNDEEVVNEEINSDTYEFELLEYDYKDNYKVEVTYVDKKGETKFLGEPIEFKWYEPSFSQNNKIIIKDDNKVISIDGDPSKKDYTIEFYNEDNLLFSDQLKTNQYTIKDNSLNTTGLIKCVIKYKDTVLDERNFFYGINPVGDVKITNINENDYVDASNLIIDYEGGENATKFFVIFMQNTKVAKEVEITDFDQPIDTTGLELNLPYSITFIADCEGQQKSTSIKVYLLSKLRAGMVNTALKEVGNEGGKKFWSWYANWGRFEWCACFLSWVADQNGIMEDKVPKFINVGDGARFYQSKKRYYKKNEYTPKAGDIIFIDWNNNDRIDHVGMVLKVEDGLVYTIEGNRRDAVRLESYKVNSNYIAGYGAPTYEG